MPATLNRATEAKAIAGSDNLDYMTSLRTKQLAAKKQSELTLTEFLAASSAPDNLVLRDGSYTTPNDTTVDTECRNVSRAWIGGAFRRDDTATVDGGVVIAGPASSKYVRDWDGVNISPEWYRVGSDSIRNDVDAINLAAQKISSGGIINCNRQKTYFGKTIALKAGTTLRGGIIKRAALANSMLTVEATAGTTTITVASTASFRVGMNVQIADGVGYDDTASGTSGYYIINNIAGNVITLHVATAVTMPIGAVVFEHAYQLSAADAVVAATNLNITIDGVTFDGNGTENDHTHSWTINNCIHLASYYQQVRILNCQFIDHPSEVITLAGKGWVQNCTFDDVYGSCVHGSASNDATSLSVVIDGCSAKNVCISSASENGHGSYFGFYTQSNATREVQVLNCRLEDLNNGYVVSHVTPGIVLQGNYVQNARGIHADISASDPRVAPRLIGNTFVDAGNLISGGVGDEHLNDGLAIVGNSFVNTSMKIVSNKSAVVTGNSFRWTSDYQTRLTAGEIDSIGANHGITLSGEVLFTGNSLINEAPTSAALVTGVYHAYSATLPPKSRIEGNRIEGFVIAIETAQNSQEAPTPSALVIEANTIVIPTVAGTRRGILCLISGARVGNNTVVAASASGAIGIRVQGVDTDTTSSLIAGDVTGNTVIGCEHWLETSWYDNVISGNVYDGVYSHLTSGTRQRIGINTAITTFFGARVAGPETNGPLSAPYFRSSVGGGWLDQDSGNWRALTSSGNFAPLILLGLGMGATVADGAAANNTLYSSSTNGKLSWKDNSGTVHELY